MGKSNLQLTLKIEEIDSGKQYKQYVKTIRYSGTLLKGSRHVVLFADIPLYTQKLLVYLVSNKCDYMCVHKSFT